MRINAGETTYEQMPARYRTGEHTVSRTPWALLCILGVVILFGGFWYYRIHVDQPLPIPGIKNAPQAPVPVNGALDLSELQVAAVNTAIPDFSSDF